eukprot:gene1059-173_t
MSSPACGFIRYDDLLPEDINFSQDSCDRTFRNGDSLHQTVRRLLDHEIDPIDFPPMRVCQVRCCDHPECDITRWVSFDNRRLAVFKICRYAGLNFCVRVEVVSSDMYPNKGYRDPYIMIRNTVPPQYVGPAKCLSAFKCPELQLECIYCNQKIAMLPTPGKIDRFCIKEHGHAHRNCVALRKEQGYYEDESWHEVQCSVIFHYQDMLDLGICKTHSHNVCLYHDPIPQKPTDNWRCPMEDKSTDGSESVDWRDQDRKRSRHS